MAGFGIRSVSLPTAFQDPKRANVVGLGSTSIRIDLPPQKLIPDLRWTSMFYLYFPSPDLSSVLVSQILSPDTYDMDCIRVVGQIRLEWSDRMPSIFDFE